MSFQTILFQHPQLFTLIGLKVDGLEIFMSVVIFDRDAAARKKSQACYFPFTTQP